MSSDELLNDEYPMCEVPHCLEFTEDYLCPPHRAEFNEWLRRKAWREANAKPDRWKRHS